MNLICKLVPVWGCLILCFGITAFAQETRSWSSAGGGFKIDAKLVEVSGNNVVLLTSKGKTLEVPIAKLSAADRKFIAAMNRSDQGGSVKVGEETRSKLGEAGLRVSSTGLALIDEPKLSKGLGECSRLRRTMMLANNNLTRVKAQEAQLKAQIDQLRKVNIELNARLIRVDRNDVTTNNQLVGAITANGEQAKLSAEHLEKLENAMRDVRGEVGKAREAYLDHILGLRKLSDQLLGKIEELAADESIKETIAKLNDETGKDFELTQSRLLSSSIRKLKSIEDTVLSESIKLRVERGTPYVSTSIDGTAQEMVLDSGANVICLPMKIAAKCGIEATSSDPDIVLVLADGSEINAKLVIIDEVRVGKFLVQKVEAAILGPEATNAEPLLGMSFLEKFKFEINPDEGTLTMVKVDEK